MPWTEIAEHQSGLVTRAQLTACAVPVRTIDNWLAGGRLHRTAAAGVYRSAGVAAGGVAQDAWYAVLSTTSPLSYLSAARWWDMPVDQDGLVHITRLSRRRQRWPDGVRVHRVGLRPEAVTNRRGLLVTTPAETVLDCLGWLPPARARTLADRAVQQGWLTFADIRYRLEDERGRWGNRQVRRLAEQIGDGAAAESERRLHQILRQAGIRGWVANLPVALEGRRYVVDVAFPELRIAIEVDGYAYHRRDETFQRDRTKQNALVRAGWRVLRFTWADLTERPWVVLRTLTALLAA